MAIVTLRYWAAAKDAAGVAEEKVDAWTLDEALEQGLLAISRRGEPVDDRVERLIRVLTRCSFLVDGEPVGTRPHESVVLEAGAVVEVLPPFAGG